MKIEIVAGHHQPHSRQTKNGGMMYWQDGYCHMGGAFPTQVRIPLRDQTKAYPPGQYDLSPESFTVGQYGDLQINRFELFLIPAAKPQAKAS